MAATEVFISIDLEADGPIPGDYSILSIGATTLGNKHERDFYLELAPISAQFDSDALAVSGLDRDQLVKSGVEARHAMQQFTDWIEQVRELHGGGRAVAVTLSEWDMGYLYWYLIHFLGEKPLGFTGIDMKSYFMGKHQIAEFKRTGRVNMLEHYTASTQHTHNALDDAREQAEIFAQMRGFDLTSTHKEPNK